MKSAPPKKVILNRHTSIELTKNNADDKEKQPEESIQEQKDEKKIIKLSSLSAKEVHILCFEKNSGKLIIYF